MNRIIVLGDTPEIPKEHWLGNVNWSVSCITYCWPTAEDSDLKALDALREEIKSKIANAKNVVAKMENDLKQVDTIYEEWANSESRRAFIKERADHLQAEWAKCDGNQKENCS